MKSEDHEKRMLENIRKTCQKAPKKLEKAINLEVKNIAKSLKLADRIDHLAKTEAFITLKDHKENFVNKPTCRLINPTKTELGKISKKIIEDINKQLIEKLKVNQWKSTKNVTDWFKKIDNKKDCKFIQFDIKEFYPAISESILEKAINFAK